MKKQRNRLLGIKTTYSTPPPDVKVVRVNGQLQWDRDWRPKTSKTETTTKPVERQKLVRRRLAWEEKLRIQWKPEDRALRYATYMQNQLVYGEAQPDTTRTYSVQHQIHLVRNRLKGKP
jgi:hypothetical protein